MTKEIVITVSPQGEARVEVRGQAGSGCKELIRQLEAALCETLSDKKTPEFFQTERGQAQQRAGR